MAQQSGWAGKKYKNRNPGRAYSGREEEGSAAVGDRLEGSTEVGGRMPPGVSPGGGGGWQGGPGSGRRCRRSGLGKNNCSVSQAVCVRGLKMFLTL